jgi:hypothetical protein
VSLVYETTNAYDSQFTYFGVGDGVAPVLKVEMDLSSSFPTEVLDLDYGGVLAYNTVTVYDTEDRYDGFVVFDDITSSVRSVDIVRGKSSISYDHFDAGTCALELSDFDSRFLPDEVLSPFYPNVKPLRQVRISATWSGDTFTLFRGYVDNWDIRWEPRQQYATVNVSVTDATKLLANFDTEYEGLDDDPAWERVRDMIADKGWPNQFTDIDDDGYSALLVQDTADRRPLLPNLQEYETAEQGALFIASDGKITWRNIARAYPNIGQPAEYVFSDTGGPGLVNIREIDFSVSDEVLYNVVSVTPVAGTEQVRTDGTSVDEFRERAKILTDVPLTTDAAADYLAAFILDKQGRPQARITSVSTDPRLSIHSTKAVLDGELLTRVDISRTPPGGTTSSYKMFVIGVRHSITPELWLTDFQTDYRITPFVLISPPVIIPSP